MAKTLIGKVTSDKRDKTITVSIVSRETHPLYRKQYSHTRKYTARDEKNEAKLGDKVEIVETRPFSKTVHYKLNKIVEKSQGSVELKEDVNAIVEEGEKVAKEINDGVKDAEEAQQDNSKGDK